MIPREQLLLYYHREYLATTFPVHTAVEHVSMAIVVGYDAPSDRSSERLGTHGWQIELSNPITSLINCLKGSSHSSI